MQRLSQILIHGFAKYAETPGVKTAQVKTAQVKTAARRWLMDEDLVKLCNACKKHGTKKF